MAAPTIRWAFITCSASGKSRGKVNLISIGCAKRPPGFNSGAQKYDGEIAKGNSYTLVLRISNSNEIRPQAL